MPRVLIIEDEPDMQFLLADNLQAEGFTVEVAATGKAGIERALSGDVSLVILDLMLPDISGFDVCKAIRAKDAALPIIVLTAKGGEVDKVVGLEIGADDYVTKPFSMRELVARIRAVLRRRRHEVDERPHECVIGCLRVDFDHREILRGTERVRLTRYENELLRLLAARRGQTVTRQEIAQKVWKRNFLSGNRTVDNYIVRLRNKIEPTPSRPEYILTVHGEGYTLV